MTKAIALPLIVFVPGVPKPQPRVKFARRGKFVTTYTPAGAHTAWRDRIAIAMAGVQFPQQPLCIDWVMVMPRAKGHWRKNGELRASAPDFHTAKPDRDNLDKAVMDQLKASGVIAEDAHVQRGELLKRWQRSLDEPVGMYLRIGPADDTDPEWVERSVEHG